VAGRVDKSKLPCNKPRRQAHGSGPSGKSHIVKACKDGKEKIIRKDKARKKSFQARHAKNIAKGVFSAAYWANKVKW